MNELEEALFKLNGGWTTVAVNVFVGAAKWFAIGYLFHLGWRLVS